MVSKTGGHSSKKKSSAKAQPKKKGNADKSSTSRKRALTPSSSPNTGEEPNKKPKLDVLTLDNLPCGTLLTLGQGDVGQLGLGDDILSRKKPAIVNMLSDKPMRKICAGGMHTVCLTAKNEIYSFGCNDECALGRETSDDSSEYEPAIVAGPFIEHKVIQVTAGDSHTAALLNTGEVYAWGCFRDSHGKLGLVKEFVDCHSPTLLHTIKEVVINIASGVHHVVMVTVDGKLYTVGSAEQGQLGRVARYFSDRGGRRKTGQHASANKGRRQKAVTTLLLSPRRVSLPKSKGKRPKVTKAFCGSYSTWVLTDDGQVYGFGLNNFNQLGLPDNENRYVPEEIPALSSRSWKHIVGGQHHTLMLDTEGKVYTMGRGEYGRLGLGEDVTQADVPTVVPSLSDIVSIAASDSISFATDGSGKGYGWGIGTNLQLTTGSEDDEWSPIELSGRNLENRKILQLDCGGQHTVIIAGEADDKGNASPDV